MSKNVLTLRCILQMLLPLSYTPQEMSPEGFKDKVSYLSLTFK